MIIIVSVDAERNEHPSYIPEILLKLEWEAFLFDYLVHVYLM